MKGCIRMVALLVAVLGATAASAGVDGRYEGQYGEQQVSAVLETMSTTVTGMLHIGHEQYLLQAESQQDDYTGQLNNMTGGAPLSLSIHPQGDALSVEIRQPEGAPMQFILNRSR